MSPSGRLATMRIEAGEVLLRASFACEQGGPRAQRLHPLAGIA